MKLETFVVDTNVLMSDGHWFKKMGGCQVIVPLVVVEELDKHKTDPGDAGANARTAIRYLENSIQFGNLLEGVTTDDDVHIRIFIAEKIEGEKNDDNIIRTAKLAIELKLDGEDGSLTSIVSNDAHLRIKAHTEGVIAIKHSKELFDKEDGSYTGLYSITVSAKDLNDMHAKGFIELDELIDMPVNAFVLLRSDENEKQTGIVRVVGEGVANRVTPPKDLFGIKAKNLEQGCAIDLMLDKDIPLVTLVGGAGSGKTLIALAAGLDLVMSKKQFKKLVIIRPPIPMGRDIGFLPGSLDEKMAAWAGPIMDNLEVLLTNNTKSNFEHLMDSGIIEIAPPTFIRGRSLNDSVILIDEAQSLTLHEVKTLVTRVGEKSKVILTGDVHQIDNPKVSAEDNGLSELVEAFKPYALAGHITLNKCERSSLAALAATIL